MDVDRGDSGTVSVGGRERGATGQGFGAAKL